MKTLEAVAKIRECIDGIGANNIYIGFDEDRNAIGIGMRNRVLFVVRFSAETDKDDVA